MNFLALFLLMIFPGSARAATTQESELQAIVVRPGDTLWAIANKYLKDPARWDEILKHNRLPSSDPTVALPGMTLRVPVTLIKEDLRAAHLVYRMNKVLFRRKETADWASASERMELFRNDALRTLEESKARVKFLNQDMLQLDPNSMAIIKPLNKDFDVELKRGGVFVGRAKVLAASAKITPKTQDTKYAATVRNDLSTLVEVYAGKAAVEAQGQTVDVGAGMATEVKMGLAPGVPTKITNLPDFEARAAEFEGDFRAVKARVATAPVKEASVRPKVSKSELDLDSINAAVDDQRVGEAISGYVIQFSKSRDFSAPIFEKAFESDAVIRQRDIRLAPGKYWCRIALIDLLGVTGKFSDPKLFALGGASVLRQLKDLGSQLILRNPSGDEVVSLPEFRVLGSASSDMTITVNGKAVRVDGEGNFSITLKLKEGDNQIWFNLSDNEGNTDSVYRKVTYKPR